MFSRGVAAFAEPLFSAFLSAAPASLSAALSSPPLVAGLCHSLLPALPSPAAARILELLGCARAPELSLPARAALIVGLSTAPAARSSPGRLPPPAAGAVAGIMQHTRGAHLTRLKEAVDVSAPGQVDLFTLLYRHLDGAQRAELLQHFALQADAAISIACGAPLSFKVVSDLDDTLRQGWADRRVPRRTWYPGARSFLAELRAQAAAWGVESLAACDAASPPPPGGGELTLGWWARGASGAARGARARVALARALLAALQAPPPPDAPRALLQAVPGSIALVSARPPLLRRFTMRTVPGVGEAPPPPTAVVDVGGGVGERGDGGGASGDSDGDVDAAALGPLFAAPTPSAAPPFHATLLMSSSVFSAATVGGIVSEKAENVSRLRCLWPEFGWVLLGDVGQGDAAVAALAAARYGAPRGGGGHGGGGGRVAVLARSPAAPGGALAAALLHDVTPGAPTTGDGGLKAAYAAGGQALFASYAGAAAHAAATGLLSRDALWRVCAATAAEAEALPWGGGAHAPEAAARFLAAAGRELRSAGWPGTATLGASWRDAEARVAGAEGAEEAARVAGLAVSGAEAQPSDKDLRLAAWTASGAKK
jgi:hypothetical protein